MKMPAEKEYAAWIKEASPRSRLGANCLWAFCVGGGICLLGEVLRRAWLSAGLTLTAAATLASVSLIFLSALFTGLGLYQKLAARAGAGTLVPITGFANAVCSPAIDSKAEGFIFGTGSKMFVIAGPVIVYGTEASVVYGIIYWITTLF